MSPCLSRKSVFQSIRDAFIRFTEPLSVGDGKSINEDIAADTAVASPFVSPLPSAFGSLSSLLFWDGFKCDFLQ